MPFCPSCGYEYRSGVTACPDCGVSLVDAPPARLRSVPHEEQVVKVAEVANEALAAMWAELLESQGIPCLAKATGAGVGGWGTAAMVSHYLYVRGSDARRAITLLRAYAGNDPSLAIQDPPS